MRWRTSRPARSRRDRQKDRLRDQLPYEKSVSSPTPLGGPAPIARASLDQPQQLNGVVRSREIPILSAFLIAQRLSKDSHRKSPALGSPEQFAEGQFESPRMTAAPESKVLPNTPSTLRSRFAINAIIPEWEDIMRQLVVRRIEDKVVRKLKERAGAHGVSMEEEHRRILREALLGSATKHPSFKEALLTMPPVGNDQDFDRATQSDRPVQL
jgi:plasmid stability protein